MSADLCPTCGTPFDTATQMLGSARGPKEGDFSVCLYCGEILRFGPAPLLLLVVAGDGWRQDLSPEEAGQLLVLQAAIRRMRVKPSARPAVA